MYYEGREHIGISNSVKRLKLIYGVRARIGFSNMDEGYGAVVEIRIPAERCDDRPYRRKPGISPFDEREFSD